MAIVNVAFVTFLALKNTPLAFLTAYSYEKLNPLHQVGGYTTIIYVFLHAAMQVRGDGDARPPLESALEIMLYIMH